MADKYELLRMLGITVLKSESRIKPKRPKKPKGNKLLDKLHKENLQNESFLKAFASRDIKER